MMASTAAHTNTTAHTNKMTEEQDQTQQQEKQSFQSKRRRKGRTAAHRRKKVLQAKAAAQAELLSNGNPTEPTNSMGRIHPSDRQYLWPAVGKVRSLTSIDQQELIKQLGYLPGNALEIAARGDIIPGFSLSSFAAPTPTASVAIAGTPVQAPPPPIVVKLYPLVLRNVTEERSAKGPHKHRARRRLKSEENDEDDQSPEAQYEGQDSQSEQPPAESNPKNLVEPFPTTYWVTHPYVKALISKLELEGMGVQLEHRLASDEDALASMARAHANYSEERRALLTVEDWSMIQSCKWEEAFSMNKGVAGIGMHGHRRKSKQKQTTNDDTNHDSHCNNNQQRQPLHPNGTGKVKCLHAHAAHYWSGCQDNLVGQWVAERVTQLLSEQHQQQHQQH